jgi:hypothetical protein
MSGYEPVIVTASVESTSEVDRAIVIGKANLIVSPGMAKAIASRRVPLPESALDVTRCCELAVGAMKRRTRRAESE